MAQRLTDDCVSQWVNETWIFWTDFQKILKCQMSGGSQVVPCRRTDRHDEAVVAFCNFVKQPKYWIFFPAFKGYLEFFVIFKNVYVYTPIISCRTCKDVQQDCGWATLHLAVQECYSLFFCVGYCEHHEDWGLQVPSTKGKWCDVLSWYSTSVGRCRCLSWMQSAVWHDAA